jgi:hypothetical protein
MRTGISVTLLAVVLLSAGDRLNAAAITALSCNASDVQAALNRASIGDTVNIPAGTCQWTTAVTWTAPANVTLSGAGTTAIGGGDRTVIVDAYNSTRPLLAIDVSVIGTFRMTGFTLRTTALTVLKENGMTGLAGPGNVRVDHIHFDNHTTIGTTKPLWIGDRVFGVVDHSLMDFYANSAIYVANGAGPDGQGNTTWASPTNFGGSDFIFFEDNVYRATVTFPCRIADVFSAGRTVWRFNTIQGCSGLEVHATGHAGDDRGARASEGYGNRFTVLPGQVNPPFDMADVSSGPMLLWANFNEPLNLKNIFVFNVTRKNADTYSQVATPSGWGFCGTQFNGRGSNWDSNANPATGYPCLDQPGRGIGDLLIGSFPSNKINSTTGTLAWPRQALEPVYFWNNVGAPHPGYGGGTNLYNDNSGGRVVANRDYYPQASGIQTTSLSPFDGTVGTGWGTLANRPATCTAGVGYFAMDQGSWNTSSSNPQGVNLSGSDGLLYKCTSTNTWTLYYTPYTYPHPLQSSSPVAPPPTTLPPAKPTNLRVTP